MKYKYYILVILCLSVKIGAQNVSIENDKTSTALFQQAEGLFLINEFTEAKKMFIKYLEQNPDDLNSLIYLSQIAVAQQNIPSIKFYNKRILSVEPTNIDALINLGVLYSVEQNYDKAVEFLSKAVKVDQDNELALFNLGVVYGTSGDLNNAVSTLNQAAKINPNNGEIFLTLGMFYLQSELYDEAEINFKRAIDISNNLTEALKGLVILYQYQGKLNESANFIRQLEELSPNLKQLNLLKANQKYLEGEIENAIKLTLEEISKYPDDADAYYLLGNLYSLTGEYKKSKEALNHAEKLIRDIYLPSSILSNYSFNKLIK
jgi:tetratricopeptide (TPR) repeat protein